MNRRTRILIAALARLPRPDPPPPGYLRLARREPPRSLARLALGPAPRVRTIDRVLPTAPAPLRVRVYTPPGWAGPAPVVVNLHGGGFVFGNLTGADWLCSRVADGVGAVVVSVDYRLAPEHPAPAPYEDAWAATCWVLQHAAELGGDPARVSVMGESAGGNLAALVALGLRDRGRRDRGAPSLVGQVLLYPATDLTLSSPSVHELPDAPMLRLASMQWYGRQYLPQGLPTSITLDDPRVSPLRAADHAGLPPTLICAAGQDPLRDDALRYAKVTTRRRGFRSARCSTPRAIHGFARDPRLRAGGPAGPVRDRGSPRSPVTLHSGSR